MVHLAVVPTRVRLPVVLPLTDQFSPLSQNVLSLCGCIQSEIEPAMVIPAQEHDAPVVGGRVSRCHALASARGLA